MRVGRRRFAERRFSIAHGLAEGGAMRPGGGSSRNRFSIAHGLAEGGAVRVGRRRFADRPLLRYTRS